MQKDFDKWNEEKKKLENIAPNDLSFHEREICSIIERQKIQAFCEKNFGWTI